MTVYGRPLPEPRRVPALPGVARTRPEAPANATLAARDEVTATLAVFVIVADQPIGAFRPGQYVSVGVSAGGELVQRPYSIVSLDATRTRLEFFVRRLPDGRLSNMLWALAPGARVRVGPVKGLFMLDTQDQRPRLMVGTGTGLAPLLAMLGDMSARAETVPTALIHGVSYHAELAFGERISAWQAGGAMIDYRPTVSRPAERRNAEWRGLTGRAEDQLERLLKESPAMRAGVAYLCGNPDMIEACSAVLADAGFAAADIRVEQFHAPTVGERRV